MKQAPLPRTRFNTVDEALHIVDSADAGQPLSIQFELRAPGRLDEARLRAAVATACHVHPMARARQLPWNPTDERYMNSCVLSNVGRVDEAMSFGDAGTATELSFSPPTRSPMGLSLGAAFYADRLQLSFRYCRSQFGAAEVAHFSDSYQAALRELG